VSARFFAWYTCGIWSVLACLMQFVSVVPGGELWLLMLQVVMFGLA
jgi:hypothetical protein